MERAEFKIIFKRVPRESFSESFKWAGQPIQIASEEFLSESESILQESDEIGELRKIVLELSETQVQYFVGT